MSEGEAMTESEVEETPAPDAEPETQSAASDAEAGDEKAQEGDEKGATGESADASAEVETSESASVEAWEMSAVEAAVEALLFASPDVLAFRAIRKIVPEEEVPTAQVREALRNLVERYERPGSGVLLVEIAGGWQFQTREGQFRWVQSLAKTRNDDRVTQAALETLAIVAYKQPITRAEVDAIRGVGSGQMIRTLMEKKMVKVVGRVDLPGRPFQYGTTPHFLEHFGLGSLRDLPQGREL